MTSQLHAPVLDNSPRPRKHNGLVAPPFPAGTTTPPPAQPRPGWTRRRPGRGAGPSCALWKPAAFSCCTVRASGVAMSGRGGRGMDDTHSCMYVIVDATRQQADHRSRPNALVWAALAQERALTVALDTRHTSLCTRRRACHRCRPAALIQAALAQGGACRSAEHAPHT